MIDQQNQKNNQLQNQNGNNLQDKEIARYPFCVFRIPETGGRVVWELTDRCNYTCDYCGFSITHSKPEEELTTEEMFSTLEGLKAKGFSHIKFTGGEPFIRKDLFQILEKANELAFISDLSTNASLITPEKAKMLSALKLKMVHSSIDGHNQGVHESVRNKNTYERTIRGVKYLVDEGIYVRIGSLIFRGSENHIQDTIESVANLGVREIVFSYMDPSGNMKKYDPRISMRPSESLKSEIEQLAKTYSGKIKVSHSFTESVVQDPNTSSTCNNKTCPGIQKLLFINNIGQISPCSWLVEEKPAYKSKLTLKQASFEEVLNSPSIKLHLDNVDSLKHQGYFGCPVRKR